MRTSFARAFPSRLLCAVFFLASPLLAAPPSPFLDYSLSPEALTRRCAQAMDKAKASLDDLAILPASERTFENTPRRLDLIQGDLADETSVAGILKHVSTEPAVRAAASDCDASVSKLLVDLYTREDLYQALKAYAPREGVLDAEDARLVEKTLADFKRNGLELAPLERARVKLMRKTLVDLEQAYAKNLSEVRAFLPVTRSELGGLPQDYIDRLEKLPDGRYKVTLDYPDFFPFMENAKDAGARRRLHTLFNLKAYPDNTPLFEEALGLRRRAARLLGYATHADYVLELRMARSAKAVSEFAERMRARLDPMARKEYAALLELKRKDEPKAERLEAWDFAYYHNLLKKTRYEVDPEKVKEYFPMERVTEGLLNLYQRLLGLRFSEIKPADAWHPDVRLFSARDASDGSLLGHFYMDLYPREGKYKHAMAVPILNARLNPDGARQAPVLAIVANFSKPTEKAPSLLKHGEVETYFHEFGHVMHALVSRAKHPRFSGFNVAWDFVEAPSQMLENWAWEGEVLAGLSSHYKDGKPLPRDLLKRMLAAKNLDAGLSYLRQLVYGRVDQAYHTEDAQGDVRETYRRINDATTPIPMNPEARPEASFGHLMGGYDAGYYGYLWSEVFAQDMFSRFQEKGILDAETGLRYRREVLEPGGSRDEMDGLKAFLGREPREDAFLKSIGAL